MEDSNLDWGMMEGYLLENDLLKDNYQKEVNNDSYKYKKKYMLKILFKS